MVRQGQLKEAHTVIAVDSLQVVITWCFMPSQPLQLYRGDSLVFKPV